MTMTPLIRRMVQADLPGVLAVASSAFVGYAHAEAQRDFSEMFTAAASRPFFHIAEIDGAVVGIAGYGESRLTYRVYELFWVGVLKEHRGKGVGKMLVSQCLSDLAAVADQVILVTCKREYFKKQGFTVVGPLPTTEGPTDILMNKDMRLAKTASR
jgi:N-acetylglutamate synthase-like GNAT family acetyltransferase